MSRPQHRSYGPSIALRSPCERSRGCPRLTEHGPRARGDNRRCLGAPGGQLVERARGTTQARPPSARPHRRHHTAGHPFSSPGGTPLGHGHLLKNSSGAALEPSLPSSPFSPFWIRNRRTVGRRFRPTVARIWGALLAAGSRPLGPATAGTAACMCLVVRSVRDTEHRRMPAPRASEAPQDGSAGRPRLQSHRAGSSAFRASRAVACRDRVVSIVVVPPAAA